MKKVLVVEDETPVRENINEILELEGFIVKQATNGKEGLRLASVFLPDLIISDVMMPELDGYGLLTELRKNPELSTVPFLFLTAKADMTDLRKGMILGADDYLTKPFTIDSLLQAVQARLAKQDELKEKAEQKLNNLRRSISTSLPHELRTPLNSILGFSEILSTGYDSIERNEIGEMSKYIYESGKRLEHLIENFILFSLLQSHYRLPENFAIISNKVANAAGELMKEAILSVASKHGRTNDIKFNLQEATIKMPEDFISKITQELADNACKFSNAGTEITVSGFKTPSGYLVSVSDKGRGMSEIQIDQLGVFSQPGRNFYEQQGSGLGLAICKMIAELFSGNITIESKAGEGTMVLAKLPVV